MYDRPVTRKSNARGSGVPNVTLRTFRQRNSTRV
jgi:hypothetical protein